MTEKVFIAVDLGAGSGRVLAARTDFSTVTLEDVHRFDNPGTELPDGSYWNLIGLYREILEGLRLAVQRYGEKIVSIGIDTWAVDFGLLDQRGSLLGMPHQYRDSRFEGMADLMHALMPEAEIFEKTGLKTNFYNTSLQLLAEAQRKSPGLLHAENLLFIPDLLAFWLTGEPAIERTIASTSQLLDPHTGDWSDEVIQALGLPRKIFGKIVPPGTVLGPIRKEVADAIGMDGIPVIATASHDTAAAVAGIPISDSDNLWLSSGTWSIMGIETSTPVTTAEALSHGFCNELGVQDSVRFLKNIAGLWLLQECRRQWVLDGETISFAEMAELARAAKPFSAFIDPDDPVFATPGNMPEKIRVWCEQSGQTVPADKGTILRIATDSLALKYRVVYERICALTGRSYPRLNAGGGGIQNELLCQATADALGIEVIAGPVEATSCGNVVTQMVGGGYLKDFTAGRDLVRRSFDFKVFKPQDTADWDAAYANFRQTIGL